jgi:predicted secreted protein
MEEHPVEPERELPKLKTNRDRLDEILAQAKKDHELFKQIVTDPRATFKKLGYDLDEALDALAEEWGVGPVGDCGHDTCRLTKECGWTVCGKTTNSCFEQEDELRIRMDQVLDQTEADPAFRQKLIADPVDTLKSLDFDAPTARWVAEHWGIGPADDCANNTCRLNTDACGWTVCGKTTNSCAEAEDELRIRMDQVLDDVRTDDGLRQKLVNDPMKTLQSMDFEPDVSRYVADQWGIGPTADCGHDTCRLTKECGWTVCGKTTNSCAEAEDELRVRIDQVLDEVRGDDDLRGRLIAEPQQTLEKLGFELEVTRYVADQLGVGPAACNGGTDGGTGTCQKCTTTKASPGFAAS